MGIEVKGIAQQHVASELCAESESQNMMLYSDGTTKFGCSYTTFEVQKNDGQLLAVEIGEVGQLMPKLDVSQEILGTICDSLENKI